MDSENNMEVVISALNVIGRPATANEICELFIKKIGVNATEAKEIVDECLSYGIYTELIGKTGNHFYPNTDDDQQLRLFYFDVKRYGFLRVNEKYYIQRRSKRNTS